MAGLPEDEKMTPLCRDFGISRISRCGQICIGRRKIDLSVIFAGQIAGTRNFEEQLWRVGFLNYDLGYFDNEKERMALAHHSKTL